jgi:hypothetical protein
MTNATYGRRIIMRRAVCRIVSGQQRAYVRAQKVHQASSSHNQVLAPYRLAAGSLLADRSIVRHDRMPTRVPSTEAAAKKIQTVATPVS